MAVALLFSAACDDDDDNPIEPPVATELNITGGDEQTIAVSTTSAPMTVTLLDQRDDPVAGRTINWTIVTGTGTLASATSVTDANGVATMTFTAGDAAGDVTIQASIAGVDPVTFEIEVQ